MPQKIAIVLPKKVSANVIYAGKHWTFRAKIKEVYLRDTIEFKNLKKVKEKCDLRFDFYFKGKTLDSSNCLYMAKMLEDCLVHYKILKNDTIEFVEDFTVKSQKGTADKVIITIMKGKFNAKNNKQKKKQCHEKSKNVAD